MNAVRLPNGLLFETLRSEHKRSAFSSGSVEVDGWLSKNALQHQKKHLSVTRVAAASSGHIAGYYTLATGQIDFGDLPAEVAKHLPKRLLPVAVLAWLGVDLADQKAGIGTQLLAQALRDCHEASQTFPFVAVIIDCLDDAAKSFYRRWQFAELPGNPYRLYLSAQQLELMMKAK